MQANNPEECDYLLFDALKEGDVEKALSLYEPNALFFVSANESVSGLADIRRVLQGIIDADTNLRLDSVSKVASADQTIAYTRTVGAVVNKAGGEIESFHSIEVVRKQADGAWKYLIDDPTGAGMACPRLD